MKKLALKPGVLYGSQLQELFEYCKEQKCALPAVNVIGSSSINAALHAARKAQSPIIIQFSNGGGVFNAGKHSTEYSKRADIAGTVAGAHHIHQMAEVYGVPVIIHTDHCQRKIIHWVDGLIEENRKFFEFKKRPLFSSHMLDLSEEELETNLATCAEYLTRLATMSITLEIELGVTGGEEDGVDNTGIDSSRLYTQPEHVLKAYDMLKPLGDFTVAASFGNTHGVYKPGNVKLTPEILKNSQELVSRKRNLGQNPLNLVFHGGSGSEKSKIDESLNYGIIKMNIDTDTQWAFCWPIREYFDSKHDYLMSQIGNPEGSDKPNKKYIDPRVWLKQGEDGVSNRLIEAFKDLNSFEKFELT